MQEDNLAMQEWLNENLVVASENQGWQLSLESQFLKLSEKQQYR